MVRLYNFFNYLIVILKKIYIFAEKYNTITMKNLSTSITIVIFALAMILTSCSKDSTSSSNNGGGGGGTVVGTHLTRITDISSQYSNDNVLYSTDIVEHRFRWTGNLVTQWDCYYNGGLDTHATISYNNSGKMTRANITKSTKGQENIILIFNYTGQFITSIDYSDINNNVVETATITYNGGKMSSLSSGYITFNFSWADDDISRLEVVDEGYDIYVYDTKLNPLDKQVALLMAVFDEDFDILSKHNVKHKQWVSNYGGTHSTDYTYIYDSSNTYPVSRTYSKEYSWGYESGETDYEYGE